MSEDFVDAGKPREESSGPWRYPKRLGELVEVLIDIQWIALGSAGVICVSCILAPPVAGGGKVDSLEGAGPGPPTR